MGAIQGTPFRVAASLLVPAGAGYLEMDVNVVPIGKAWHISYFDCGPEAGVTIQDIRWNGGVLGFYVSGGSGDYKVLEKFGQHIITRPNNGLTINATNSNATDKTVLFWIYGIEVSEGSIV